MNGTAVYIRTADRELIERLAERDTRSVVDQITFIVNKYLDAAGLDRASVMAQSDTNGKSTPQPA